MTWAWQEFMGGEARDSNIDGSGNPASLVPSTTQKKTGVAALYGADSANYGTAPYILPYAPDFYTRISMIQGWLRLGGNPATRHYLMSTDATSNFKVSLQVETNRSVRLFRATAASYPDFWTPWFGPVASADWTHIAFFIDPLTFGLTAWLATIYLDKIHAGTWNVGPCAAGRAGNLLMGLLSGRTSVSDPLNSGVDIYWDDVCGAYSTDPNDAPHLSACPVGQVLAQHPNSDAGRTTQWEKDTAGANTGSYTEWDDAAGNDGDTTYNRATTTGKTQDSNMESRATVGVPDGATILEQSTGIGPSMGVIHRTVAGIGSKFSVSTVCNRAGAETLTSPGTSYAGERKRLARSGGLHWTRDDLDGLTLGLATGAASHDMEERATTIMMQWLFSTENLPLAPPPTFTEDGCLIGLSPFTS